MVIQCPKEADDQIRLVVWLQRKGLRFNASAAGGSRNLLEAVKFKRMGVSPGWPDIFIPLPISPHHGLLIELKRAKGGKVSEAQREWISYLRSVGYKAEVAAGFDEAVQIVEEYLALAPKPAA